MGQAGLRTTCPAAEERRGHCVLRYGHTPALKRRRSSRIRQLTSQSGNGRVSSVIGSNRCLPIGSTRATLRCQRPQQRRAVSRAQRCVECGIIGLEMPSASPTAHLRPPESHRAEPRFDRANMPARPLLAFAVAIGARHRGTQRGLCVLGEREGGLVDRHPPVMHALLQLIEGKRGVGQEKRQCYHQSPGGVCPSMVRANSGKYGPFFSVSNRSPMRRF